MTPAEDTFAVIVRAFQATRTHRARTFTGMAAIRRIGQAVDHLTDRKRYRAWKLDRAGAPCQECYRRSLVVSKFQEKQFGLPKA